MSELPRSVLDLIAEGRKIEAIREVRDLTGSGLREAKEIVEQIERGETVSLNARQRSSSSGRSTDAVDPNELAARVFDLVEDGRTIQAIKEVRSATGVGLAEAKQIVERAVAGQSLRVSDGNAVSSSQPIEGNPPARILVAVTVAGVLVLLAVILLLLAA